MFAPLGRPGSILDRLRARQDALAHVALCGLIALTAVFLFLETRSTSFWFDDWQWITGRRGAGLASLLAPHNGHFSLVPLALYKALFATVGLEHFAPYLLLGIAGHLITVVLLFRYARPRVGGWWALAVAVLLLTFGPGWQTILWPLQVSWMLSLAAAVGALLALDRRDLEGDLAAGLCASVALASSGIGVPVVAGLLVEVLAGRRRRTAVWAVALPLGGYALWWLLYQDSASFTPGNIARAPAYAADVASATLAALFGLSAVIGELGGGQELGVTLGWGRPLAIVAAVALVWRLSRLHPIPTRVLTLLTMVGAFWALLALQRAQLGDPAASRYEHVGAVLLLLLLAELLGGVALPRRGGAVLALLGVLAISLSNLGDMRGGARFLRAQAETTRAALGALELARADVRPETLAEGLPGFPLIIRVPAREYFAATKELGSPAAGPAELPALREEARTIADAELRRIQRVGLRPAPAATTASEAAAVGAGTAPLVDRAVGGSVRTQAGCVVFSPETAGPAATVAELQLTLPPRGILARATGGEATASLRRFASTFASPSLDRLAAGGAATLRPGRDVAAQPWHVRLAPSGGLTACGL